jgi:predicted deacylase
MHVYGLTPHASTLMQLSAQLGAQAVLLATESGDSPFDEACSRPWLDLQKQFGAEAVPLACLSTTVELRGEADVSHELANQDAQALVSFLQTQGFIKGEAPQKAALCQPTPLSGSEPITAPSAGVIVFHRQSGDRVQTGDAIADIVNPDTGAITTVRCASSGVMYARCSTRWAHAGKRLAKIAGTSLARTGKLLSP